MNDTGDRTLAVTFRGYPDGTEGKIQLTGVTFVNSLVVYCSLTYSCEEHSQIVLLANGC